MDIRELIKSERTLSLLSDRNRAAVEAAPNRSMACATLVGALDAIVDRLVWEHEMRELGRKYRQSIDARAEERGILPDTSGLFREADRI